ncbi:brassinosteroid-related acyltransferase 1 [Actinidia eriantha]|uniref:brassinosteroid-related acyltransferase 1 n=1 Tax=Actinidia eriantha TaxID=165200 RepID=UPI002584A30B|nr:brassinosteroid-related acyltransferase 1 [Actinidia eriantha]
MASHKEEHFKVSLSRTLSVYPKTLHPLHLLTLSNLDRQCPIHMYLVFFYKPSQANKNLSASAVFGQLKAGLEEALSVWYPAAGRLTVGPGDGKLNLWCNNGGAVLVEAEAQVRICELGDLSQYNELFEDLVFKPLVDEGLTEMPLVVAQVTRFGCGGYSLGIGTSHSLFDGHAAYNFLHAWASLSNIKASQPLNHHHPLHPPVHERGRFLETKETNDSCRNSNPTTRVVAIDHLYQLIREAADDRSVENYVLRTFHLSGEMIERLKQNVFGEERGRFSSFEVVSAHLWKARTKALGLTKDRLVCLQFAVDTRNKMVPPLPKGFTGNAYVLASVALTAGQLEEGHVAIAEKIKKAKNSITNDYIDAYIKALDGPQANLPPLKELTLVSDWRRLPFHKVGFMGEEAAYVSPLVPPLPQVAYLTQSPIETRGIDLRIGLLPNMETAFSHYFLRNVQ